MQLKKVYDTLRPWLKPGLTCLLALVLICRPTSITALLAGIIGYLLALIGCGLLVYYFFSHRPRRFIHLIAAIILIIMGYSVIQNPLSLVNRMTRFIGVIVLLHAARGYLDREIPHSTPFSTASCVVGVVLLVMPGAVSRLVVTICGFVLLAIGIGMLLDQKNAPTSFSEDNIIDAG